MTFKIDIGNNGKTYHFELNDESREENLIGKKINDVVEGSDIDDSFSGYEFKITGLSDKQGFPARADIKGQGVKRILLTYGVGMKRIKKGKKKKKLPKGLKLRKSIHANVIDENIAQINVKVVKNGEKPLNEILGKGEGKEKEVKGAEQAKAAEGEAKEVKETAAEGAKEASEKEVKEVKGEEKGQGEQKEKKEGEKKEEEEKEEKKEEK